MAVESDGRKGEPEGKVEDEEPGAQDDPLTWPGWLTHGLRRTFAWGDTHLLTTQFATAGTAFSRHRTTVAEPPGCPENLETPSASCTR